MIQKLILVFFAICLLACSQHKTSKTGTTDKSQANKQAISTDTNQISEASQEQVKPKIPKFNEGNFELLDNISASYIEITPMEDEHVIYDYCDAGIPSIDFVQTDGKYLLSFFMGQESVGFEIHGVTLSEGETDKDISSYYFYLTSDYYDDTTIAVMKLIDDYEVSWTIGDLAVNSLFASKELENIFPTVIEPCLDCWDEEMCADEIAEENSIGIGAVNLDLNSEGTLFFFSTPNELSRTFIFEFNNIHGDYYWLDTRDYFPEYDIAFFECLDQNGEWYKVKSSTAAGHLWLKKDPRVSFVSWAEYFSNSFSVFRKDAESNPVRLEPSDEAAVVEECNKLKDFEVLDFERDWIKVGPIPIEESDPAPDCSGWIRCVKDNNFLIDNYWTL